MSDMIQGAGGYRQKNGNKATVEFINGQWAFGYDSSDDWNVWSCSSGESDQESGPDGAFNIVAPWTAFSVGDLVLVNNPSSEWHQHYGEVTHISQLFISVKIGEARPGFGESELTRVTLPAPLPEGFRLKPRNVKPVSGVDIGITGDINAWDVVDGWAKHDAIGWESFRFRSERYFFAEPIPKEQWTPTADCRVKVEQRWECNGKSEWRPVEVEQ